MYRWLNQTWTILTHTILLQTRLGYFWARTLIQLVIQERQLDITYWSIFLSRIEINILIQPEVIPFR